MTSGRALFARSVLLAAAFFLANQAVEFAALRSLSMTHADVPGWDTGWYARIISEGYDSPSRVEQPPSPPADAHTKMDSANWAFFPLFPLLARIPVALFGLSAPAAAIVTGKIFFFLSILAFIAFARRHAPGVHPVFPAMAAALSPYAFYGNTGYTEPLFLLLSCLFFLALKSGNNVLAGVAGAFLTATRFVGLSAAAAYLVANARNIMAGRTRLDGKLVLGLLLIPVGLAFFMLFLHWKTGDALAFLHVQRAWGRSTGNPLETLAVGLDAGPINRYLAVTGIVALAAPLVLVKRGQLELAAFSWCCTLAPLATGLVSMPRFVWWQAPVLLLVTLLLAWRRAWIIVLPAFLAGLFLLTRAWLLGSNHLV